MNNTILSATQVTINRTLNDQNIIGRYIIWVLLLPVTHQKTHIKYYHSVIIIRIIMTIPP